MASINRATAPLLALFIVTSSAKAEPQANAETEPAGSLERAAGAPAPSPSEPDAEAASKPNLRLGFDFGLFSPIGLVGPTLQLKLTEVAALEAGVGFGFSGVQLSGMIKARTGAGPTLFVMGVGPSYGLNPWDSDYLYLNADLLGFERVFDSGMSLSGSAGLTFAIWHEKVDFAAFPYLRVGFGHWF